MKPFTLKLTPLFAVAALLPAQAVIAQQIPGYADYSHMGYGGWFFGPLMMILVLGAIAGAVAISTRLSMRTAAALLSARPKQ